MVVRYISFTALYTGETLDFFESSGNIPVSKLWLINNYSTSARRIRRVCTLFWTENSSTFQGLSRTPFSAKRALSLSFLVPPHMSNFILKVFLSLLLLCNWESGFDKVSTEIQGLSSTDCNFQELSRPWIFMLKSKDLQGLSRCVRTLNMRW